MTKRTFFKWEPETFKEYDRNNLMENYRPATCNGYVEDFYFGPAGNTVTMGCARKGGRWIVIHVPSGMEVYSHCRTRDEARWSAIWFLRNKAREYAAVLDEMEKAKDTYMLELLKTPVIA